jgi:predicted double-glycine peptidase
MDFKCWLEANIMVPVQPAKQQKSFDCGAGALRAIAEYYGINWKSQKDFIKLCNSSKEKGTKPNEIIHAAKSLGLKTKIIEHMTLQELKKHLLKHKAVICSIQAWGTKKGHEKLKDGHYVVAIGFDKKNMYFQDPSTKNKKRGFIPIKEFVNRWVDIEYGSKHPEYCLGIVVWQDPNIPLNVSSVTNATKIK